MGEGMMAEIVSLNAADAMKGVKLSVRFVGARRLAARIWLASKLFVLAAWVAGVEIEIDSQAE
jgi:hypothetical protein